MHVRIVRARRVQQGHGRDLITHRTVQAQALGAGRDYG